MATKYYAWSTLYLGGKSKEDPRTGRRLITERNLVQPGTVVSRDKLKCSKEEWDALVEGGSVRTYKFPKISEGSTQSPTEVIMSGLREGREEIPTDKLIELALSHSVEAAVVEEAEESELAEVNELS
jgi:hypothetical protein